VAALASSSGLRNSTNLQNSFSACVAHLHILIRVIRQIRVIRVPFPVFAF